MSTSTQRQTEPRREGFIRTPGQFSPTVVKCRLCAKTVNAHQAKAIGDCEPVCGICHASAQPKGDR